MNSMFQKIVHSLQGENACKCCWALNLLKQNDIPIPFKNCNAQVGYNSERSLRDDSKHMPSKHSLLGARCFRESDYEPNVWTKGSGC